MAVMNAITLLPKLIKMSTQNISSNSTLVIEPTALKDKPGFHTEFFLWGRGGGM